MNDLEIFILSRQRRRNMYNIPYIQNLKRNETNEFIYKTENELIFAEEDKGKGYLGSSGWTCTHCYI